MTHLIAKNAQGQKYQFALEWGIKTIGLKWFNDSLERGMVLEEGLYNPSKPEIEQGIGAWNRSSTGVSGKRSKASDPVSRRPRKLRRTASTKLSGQTEGIWTDIVGRNVEPADPSDHEKKDQKSSGFEAPVALERPVQALKSFASETASRETGDSVTQETAQDISQAGPDHATNQGILFGCRFFIHGFTAKQVCYDLRVAIARSLILCRCQSCKTIFFRMAQRYLLPLMNCLLSATLVL